MPGLLLMLIVLSLQMSYSSLCMKVKTEARGSYMSCLSLIATKLQNFMLDWLHISQGRGTGGHPAVESSTDYFLGTAVLGIPLIGLSNGTCLSLL